MSTHPDITALAAACAARLASAAGPLEFERDFQSLLDVVRRSDSKFAFEREGRPAAVAAVREALPSSEQELLDAILEDHTCELAAVYEAMLQVALAGTPPDPADRT